MTELFFPPYLWKLKKKLYLIFSINPLPASSGLDTEDI